MDQRTIYRVAASLMCADDLVTPEMATRLAVDLWCVVADAVRDYNTVKMPPSPYGECFDAI